MADTTRIPDVWDLIRDVMPASGPVGVPNMGGIAAPRQPSTPTTTAAQPTVGAAPPGPAPALQPTAAPSAPAAAAVPKGARPAAAAPMALSPAAVPAGVSVPTPRGEMYRTPAGRVVERLNDAGRADYKQRQAEALVRYGPYPGMDDPNHPAPLVIPGGPNFNPYAPKGREWTD